MSKLRVNDVIPANGLDIGIGTAGGNLIVGGASTTVVINGDINITGNVTGSSDAVFTNITVAGEVSLGTGTSISSPGTNILTLGTNSAERLRIHSTGYGEFSSGAITKVVSQDDVATTSGTSKSYDGIPSWATKITLLFDRVSTTGSSELLVQLGTSGGAITSGYDSSSSNSSGATLETSTAGFVLYVNAQASELTGKMEIQRAGTSNKWISSHVMKYSGNTRDGAGVLTTYSGTIDRVVVTTEGGTNSFDGGAVTVYYEA